MHMVTHSDIKPYRCSLCQASFKFSTCLIRHMVTHSDVKPYQCSLCKASFKLLDLLKQHMVTHSDVKPYRCSLCQASFKLSNHLKQHMVTHSDVKPYQCSLCKASFKLLDLLKQHMVTHSDVKPYQCSLCKASFKLSKHLKQHMLTHSKVKNHSCTACPLAFKRLDHLKKHMVTHSDLKPYKCSVCDASFKRRDKLSRHMLTHRDVFVKATGTESQEMKELKTCVQLESISGPAYIKPELAKHIPQSNWKHEDAVKLELNSQDAIYCIKTGQVPGEELHHIKPEYAVHIEQSDSSHESAVKVECMYQCQDITCLIKTEQDSVHSAKTEEYLVFKQEEQDHSHIVKTETGWPGQHAVWQHDNDENIQEMNSASLIIPEVTHSDVKPYQCSLCKAKYFKDMEDEFRGLLDMNKIEGVVQVLTFLFVIGFKPQAGKLCFVVLTHHAASLTPHARQPSGRVYHSDEETHARQN
ncbi:zinc finger protein 729-like [Pomacea canaliculata]|uniref:zinc finger protein 729-like n=1 Tax=Pomacea canaliculata TaxID=400727 RepID=UPI000D737D98|nr:zinc finger protein 729-like [Pomacea canaliculata]